MTKGVRRPGRSLGDGFQGMEDHLGVGPVGVAVLAAVREIHPGAALFAGVVREELELGGLLLGVTRAAGPDGLVKARSPLLRTNSTTTQWVKTRQVLRVKVLPLGVVAV